MAQVPELDRVKGRFGQVNPGGLLSKSGRALALLLSEAEALAEREGAHELREWHLVKAIVDTDANNRLRGLGIDPEALLRRVGELEGWIELSPSDMAKKWCFGDANVFLR